MTPFRRPESNSRSGDIPGDQVRYLADENTGLRVIDLSDSRRPEILGNLSITGALTLEVTGDIAYVATSHGLTVADVSDPMDPSALASVGLAGFSGQLGAAQ
jgi:hypothetical protein